MNIRYATDTHTFNVWTLHAPGRYVFVPVDGPVVLFEYGTCLYLATDLDSVDEVRKSVPWFYFLAGPRTMEKAELWSRDIIDLMRKHGGPDQRLAVDRCEPWGARHLTDAGIQLFDAQEPLENARMLKTPEEIQAMQLSMDVCDVGVDRIRQALRPGLTENELWAMLHEANIAHDGEWIECRLLVSGPRTNPWFQEAGNRKVQAGELVAFDSDMVGPLGYLADISRTLICPGKAPTAEQRKLYDIAQEQILTNIELIKPGLSFKEFGEKCWPVPDEYVPNRYMMMIHGAGLVDEFPTVAYAADYADWGYDGYFQENMVVCVESFIGEVGGAEGVKLEQQVLITSAGAVPMSHDPMIDALRV
jgi:Xaa-Pro aminopeptidase